MIDSHNTVAVVVWYHPTEQQVDYIAAYASALKRVYIVDNSDIDNGDLAKGIPNAIYIANLSNKGIAYALNVGYQRAIEDSAEWIVSFDQDSHITASLLTEYMHLCEACPIPNVGIYAPYPSYGNSLPDQNIPYQKRECVITSGALMHADTYRVTGDFRDEFFIDLVDDEYCLRVKRLGKEIVIVNCIVMEHHLGNGFVTTPLLHHQFIEHNALRHYYIVRNTLVLIREYPERKAYYRKQLRKRIKRLCLYDWHDKWHKIKMCLWALYDYRHHHMNQFNH